jgi:hypothetical protein
MRANETLRRFPPELEPRLGYFEAGSFFDEAAAGVRFKLPLITFNYRN